MKTKTIIWLTDPQEVDNEHAYCAYDNDMSTEGWIKVDEVEIEHHKLTLKESIPKAVENLRTRKMDVRAKAAKKETDIEALIQNLLAISWEGGAP